MRIWKHKANEAYTFDKLQQIYLTNELYKL